jgi:Protein of unknown function (DUF2846)
MIASRTALLKTVASLCLVAIAFGCATVPETATSADIQAKQFQAVSDKAVVYLYRQSNGFGDTLDANTHLDGQLIGALAPNTYQMIDVAPGHHTLSVAGPTNSEQADLEAAAGKVYFYAVSIKWAGPMIRHRHIEAVSEADGRAAINTDKRAVTTIGSN